MKTRIYLAARYSRHPEMRVHAAELEAMGYEVFAEWIMGKHDDMSSEQAAMIDLQQVKGSSIVISFTEHPGSGGRNRGGRHAEFGAALALRKRCIVVGPRENVFHHHPAVDHFDTWEEALTRLAGGAK